MESSFLQFLVSIESSFSLTSSSTRTAVFLHPCYNVRPNVCLMDKGGKMTIFMAILWPVLFLASITISLVSWFKLRQQSDKVYFSVKGWVLVAYIAFVGMMLAYAPLAIRYVGWLLMLDAAAIIFGSIIFLTDGCQVIHPSVRFFV